MRRRAGPVRARARAESRQRLGSDPCFPGQARTTQRQGSALRADMANPGPGLAEDLELLLRRARIDVAGLVDRPHLEDVLARLQLLVLLRRLAALERLLVELAFEARARLAGGELELDRGRVGLRLGALDDLGLRGRAVGR